MPSWSPQQEAALKAVRDWLRNPAGKQWFYLAGYAGTGKEQPVSCLVQTPAGPKPIGSLSVGDEVFGRDGRPTRVLGVYPQGAKPVYRVRFRDGSETRCGLEHLWTVIDNHQRERVIPLRRIIELGVTHPSGPHRFRVPLCAPVQYPAADLPVDPYILGVLLGDGYLSGNAVIFSTPDADADIVENVAARLPDGLSIVRDDAPPCPRYTIKKPVGEYRNPVRQALCLLGLAVKSRKKRIPAAYLRGSIQQRTDLLRGLMDTDGSSVGNRISFSTTSADLAADTRELVQSLGGTAIVKTYRRVSGGTEYDDFQINVKVLFNPFLCKRKAANYRPSKKNPPSRYIWSIEPDGVEEQVCIKVDAPDELYLTDEYIVTHNTTLAMHLAAGVDGDVIFGAYTGKAALVMQHKGCAGAATLHSLIYKLDEEGWGGEPKFVINRASAVRGAALVIVDEVSMVGEDLARDLLSFGTPVLVLGDPAQLPPVKAEGFFTKREPDFMLTEVHRQALGNPIIAMSMDVREGRRLELGTYGESRIISGREVETDDVLAADQLLVGKNLTRHRYNQRMRHLRGFEGDLPNKGERLVCLRNNRHNGLLNGQTWEVEKAEFETFGRGPRAHVSDTDVTLAITDEMTRRQVETKARIEDFQGREIDLPWQALRDYDRFDFGYALTVHKAQGSQWDNVFLFDESDTFREDRSRWLYTGLTRAAERITVVI